MIKKLQRKFILITMGSLLIVMILIIGSINGINLYQMQQSINDTIKILSDNQGQFPSYEITLYNQYEQKGAIKMNAETPFKTRYFIVNLNNEGNILNIDTGHIKAISSEDAQAYATKIYNSNKSSGFIGIYKYKLIETSSGYMVIFLDCNEQINNAQKLLLISFGVAIATLILVFILVSVFSKRAIKPIIESSEKQKQFITDAGHEIKTPIAIISANADVLELTNGKSEWISSIRNQTTRLDKLVKNMLMLSKMEEGNIKLVFHEINISKIVEETAKTFEAIAEIQNKTFLIDVKPDIKFHGDENSIQQLISTLADNAIKYANDKGTIKISLLQTKKEIKLTVYNTVEHIETNNLNKLFDRFYRSDSSRARETGGYGIGLAIAKSITETHHGKISVKSEDGKSICFTAEFKVI